MTESSFLKWCPVFNPKNLQPFFDISTHEVLLRLGLSLVPLTPRFHRLYHEKPDLYGPFWVLTSVIASLFISGNLSRYIRLGAEDFEYNFTIIPIAAGIIYGLGLGLPLVIHAAQQWFGSNATTPTPITTAIGIYGYSFSSFLLVTILCAIPVDWLQWLLIIFGAVTSLGFLMRTYWDEFSQNLDTQTRWIAVGLLCAVQLVLLLMFKLYFFKHV